MKCLVCASLVGLYFTSFERQWHLQVVEITEVLQLSFSEPKSINSRNGPSLSPCERCNNMSELEYLLHNRQHIASIRIQGCSSSVTFGVDGVYLSLSCSHFDFGIELVNLLSEVASQLGSLCFQCWCEESILNREHFHVQGNVSHLQTHRLEKRIHSHSCTGVVNLF